MYSLFGNSKSVLYNTAGYVSAAERFGNNCVGKSAAGQTVTIFQFFKKEKLKKESIFMSTKTNKKSTKKVLMLSVVALLLVASITMGTIAWLTAQDSLTNTFTIGNFTKPEDPDDRPDAQQPEGQKPTDPNISEYMIEPSWDKTAEHKLVPGGTLLKDPYVGIGKGSENAVVYVYVDNPFLSESVYFKLSDGWEAVEGQVTEGTEDGTYVSGLFKYVNDDETGILVASATDDSWTTRPVFYNVIVDKDANIEDLDVTNKEITVSCFIHQAYDGTGAPISADEIEAAAIDALVNTGTP